MTPKTPTQPPNVEDNSLPVTEDARYIDTIIQEWDVLILYDKKYFFRTASKTRLCAHIVLQYGFPETSKSLRAQLTLLSELRHFW